MSRIQRLLRSEWLLLLIVTALAAILRLYALDRLPAGLYHDEAYNGLDALDVIRGLRPIYFEANNGREPLFIYLVALSVSLLGRSPLAIRLVAAVLGTLTVPAAYWMARELLGRREALLTALVTALTFWHLNLSRLGLRAVSLPLCIALCLGWFVRGLHRQRWYDFVLAGSCLGISLCTYLAARFLPIVFLVVCVYWLWQHQPVNKRGLLLFFVTALLIALPLLIYFARHLSAFLVRSSQVSIFNPQINQGDFSGTLARHIGKTLSMFNWRGDFIPRHNLPYRPVFDPVMGLFFLLGLVISLRRAAKKPEYGILLIAWLVMLLPTILAEDAPHFLRGVGILPVLFIFPAVGLATLLDTLRVWTLFQVAVLAVAFVLGWSGYATVGDYFFRHVRSEAVYYNFETGAVELSASINRFLGTGWQQGAGWRVVEETPDALEVGTAPLKVPRHIYLDGRLWRDWASLRYLVPATRNLVLLSESASPPPETGDEVQVIVWPYAEYSHYLSLLPKEHVISVREGPLERGDLEKQARLLCLIYEAMPAREVPSNLQTRFEKGIELLGYTVQSGRQGMQVRLFWRAAEALDTDYSVFVHWKRGDQMITQSDSYPAQGHYPTHLWRAGDIVVDEHLLNVAVTASADDSISIGLYEWQTMKRLQVLDASGNAIADSITFSWPQP